MHDRTLAPRSRRHLSQQTAATRSFGDTQGAAPEGLGDSSALLDHEHVGIPHIITRRARWVTSRLRQR